MKIAVVKYNAGNIYSVDYALKRLGVEATITSDKEVLMSADKVIFPGVGEAETTMSHLRKNRLDEVIKNLKQPVLGICLGMQLLFEKSHEYGEHAGLGLICGEVRPLAPVLAPGAKVPHMGWNSLHLDRPDDPLLSGVREGDFVYYVHSFYAAGCGESSGLLNLAAQIDKNGNTLVLDGGDSLQGTPLVQYYLAHADEFPHHPVAEAFNAMGCDYFTLGNHDFNFDYDALRAYLCAMDGVCLCANVQDLGGALPLLPETVHTLKNGLRIGSLDKYISASQALSPIM